ncbi:hypothetical protein [Paludisphaera borealis]|uniref:Uncharacterized protein n=1 Tax=Paludisphaera borealis TaxID=1387353 RepID=A0A1U7CJB2_9BACT|nr:hypothetical protein [Paludisphaera borealis]APW59025.1 hypothetical protein BSF38_00438 [Paludisphaera borealis]
MKKSLAMTALVLATCIPIGLAAGTAVRRRAAGAAAQPLRQTVEKAFIAPDAEAQAVLREQDVMRYRGTEIRPHPDAGGPNIELQSRIGRLFALHDPPAPPARLAHFAWLDRPGVRINGWYGTIKNVVQEDDRTLVRVQVLPHLASEAGAVTSTTASYLETYAVTDDGVQFLESEAPQGGLTILMTD